MGGGVAWLAGALEAGVGVGGFLVRGRRSPGRFPEEVNVDVEACGPGGCSRVAVVKVFGGRGPYRPWVEVFNVDPSIPAWVEDVLLDLAASALGPGQPLYFEYYWDPVTVAELERGVHPALSRLGFKMLVRGFTWFKDWYYPEGFMEGGQKLQAEKPVGPGRRAEHLSEVVGAARRLLDAAPEGLEAALSRARAALCLLAGECV